MSEAYLTQGTEEWKAFRRTKITATDCSVILGLNPWKNTYELLREKLGIDPEPERNERMQRGIDLEPKARELFFNLTGHWTMPLVMVSPTHDFMMASLDGMTLDGKFLVEIKCPSKAVHKQACEGKIPRYYYCQCMHQLAVTGLEKMFYFSFDGVEEGAIVEVYRDDTFIKQMIISEKEFHDTITNMIDLKWSTEYSSCPIEVI